MRTGRRTLLVLACGALCAAGVSGCARGKASAEDPPTAASATAPVSEGAGDPALVELPAAARSYLSVEAILPQADTVTAQAPGRVEFRESGVARLGAPLAGKVERVNVRDGALVNTGDPIVTLYSPAAAAARADLIRAESADRAALDRLARENDAVARGVGLEVERVEARAQREEARAELDRARETVRLIGPGEGDTVVVRAPIDGTVLAIHAALGASVDPAGEPLAELGNPGALWVVALVSEEDLDSVHPGDTATITAGPARTPLDGRVVSVGAAPEADVRRTPVYVEATADPSPLRSGMYVRVALHDPGPDVLSVPTSAIVIKDGRHSLVYVEHEDGKFERREVTAGRAEQERVRILSGLSPGERVVVRGALLLDGAAEQLL
jgi:membrane fusion protein, heavy metal efflux system